MKKAKQDLCQQGKLIWLRNKLAVTAAYGKHQCQAQMPIIPVEPVVRVGWLDTNIILTSLATNTRQWRCMDDAIDSIVSEPKLLEEIEWLRIEQPSVWTNFLTISVTRLHQKAKKKKIKAPQTHCAMTNLVLKPSNRAVNHVHYPASHQRNSESPNTANYCSCWQIQSRNHVTSCQLHALTTETPPTEAAIKARAARRQQSLSLLCPHCENSMRCPRRFPQTSISQQTKGNAAKHTVSVGVLIISKQEAIVKLLPWIKRELWGDSGNF